MTATVHKLPRCKVEDSFKVVPIRRPRVIVERTTPKPGDLILTGKGFVRFEP